MKTIDERIDELAADRLEGLEPYPVADRRPKKDPWVIRSLRGETTVGKIGGVVIDVAASFLPRWADRLIGIARKHRERPMKKAIRRALSADGGSLIRVRDEDGKIDVTAIAATLIRLGIILGLFYLADRLGLNPMEILSIVGG